MNVSLALAKENSSTSSLLRELAGLGENARE